MNDPEGFAQTNTIVVREVEAALKKYGHLIHFRGDGQDSAIDAGCGPGNTFAQVTYPFIKDQCSEIIGVDLAKEMIEYCKNKYADLSAVKFVQLNVENEKEVKEFVDNRGLADHVFASFLFHWFFDEEQGIRNINSLLKPGGDLFSVHLHSAVPFYMYEHIPKMEKWSGYFDRLERLIPKSTTFNHSEKELRETLTKCGFTDIVVELIRQKVIIKNYLELKTLNKSTHWQIENIPADKLDEYLTDYFEAGMAKNLYRELPSGEFEVDFNVYISFGRKPKN